MFRWLAPLLAAAALLGAPASAHDHATAAGTSGAAPAALFVNLTSDDPWRAGMALNFAKNVRAKGHDVVVFLNVEAVRLAVPRLPQHRFGLNGKTAMEVLKELAEAGVTVIVCPMCLEVAGFAPADLMEGVELGKPERTIPALMGDGVRVMSY